MALAVHAATPERWRDLESLFGPNGACAGCWCMWWRLRRKEFEARKGGGNRAALRRLVESGAIPGLLAYDGGLPVGWCALCPRAELPVLGRSRFLKPVDHLPVWSLSCFFVRPGHRRRGVTAALIAAAVERARAAGAPAVEAYPWDTAERKATTTVYTGLASTFRRLGFTEVARRAPHRPILRLATR
ncbi:MAG TPA: GNAT family N-acetyltransferase [Geminicoccaceae bacterium]|nr:GNAT family N-acetyltransferase [Geminicoccaceae bacterium]